jgi:hypothetical protein
VWTNGKLCRYLGKDYPIPVFLPSLFNFYEAFHY